MSKDDHILARIEASIRESVRLREETKKHREEAKRPGLEQSRNAPVSLEPKRDVKRSS